MPLLGVTTLSVRGQIVIPKNIRKKLKLKLGDKFIVSTKRGHIFLKLITKA